MTWFRRREDKKHRLSAIGTQLVADTEAFLSGDYANQLERRRDVVPGWARLNSIAHGDLEDLRQAEQWPAPTRLTDFAKWPEETWRSALQVLASELLAFVENDAESLSQIQQIILKPLELNLMRTEAESGLTAFELVQITRAALRSSTP